MPIFDCFDKGPPQLLVAYQASGNTNPSKMADGANSRSVIVYEPATQTVSIRKIRDLETSPIIIQRTPKFKTHVKISSESSGPDPVRLIAQLDLRKLGAIASAKRACGGLGQIYVMDVPDAQKSRMVLD